MSRQPVASHSHLELVEPNRPHGRSRPGPEISSFLLAASLILFLCVGSGCIAIINRESQSAEYKPVDFSSKPEGAMVSINGTLHGPTPTTIMVKQSRKRPKISMSLDGYSTEQFALPENIFYGTRYVLPSNNGDMNIEFNMKSDLRAIWQGKANSDVHVNLSPIRRNAVPGAD